ncbi:3-hydroxyacyl-ACP dehydratase FabZ family protein [Actinokineospora fastidiosa]|uniref:ApeI dehydratase-like domain-containing protein n=1 Tax=Actinokineospora fastidiosa TaxID=1816 RepID=A0A918LEG4_9PSEU|nr:hypothetical protein [Actinokineospora fastidiosa]GGS36186.1 hypothetical protein GCM10010171_33530 [Actinokineospora fastidiosa]
MTTPVRGPIHVAADGRALIRLDPDDPIFAGHYPGFPIFPGVGLIECVHRSAQVSAPGELRLAAIESTRFTGPTFPGDELTVTIKWSEVDDGWRCAAEVASPRGDAATVRLRYQEVPS